MKALFWIIFGFVTLLFGAFLELNQNTIAGWILFILLVSAFVFFSCRNISRPLLWVLYIVIYALIVFITWPPVKAVPAADCSNPVKTGTVMTEKGLVRGVYTEDKSVEVYTGIPYAKPPVGELRWCSPQDPDSWEGVRECDSFAPMSMQVTNLPVYDSLTRIIGFHDYRISLKDNWIPPVSEDSLYLNVWKPSGEHEKLPVIVYIHGGSLQTGQSWYSSYNGETFASNGIVTVTFGYRLGVFGFYADRELPGSGNFGLEDQIKALEWVRDNISAFGGDPDNVTIVGESAGAVCVDALCVSPLAKGLFRRAVLESSTLSSVAPPHSFRSYEEALESSDDLKARYSVSSVSELRKLDASKIVKEMNTQHHVTVDGRLLPDTPYNLRKSGIHNEEALLHGYNLEESGPFIIFSRAKLSNYENKVRGYFKEYADDILSLYNPSTDEEADRYWALIYGAVFFNYPHYCLQRIASSQGEDAYEYLFTKSNGMLSSWHSGEIMYAFGNIPEDSNLFDESDRNLSFIMNSYWSNFARYGKPDGEGLPEFSVSADGSKLLELGSDVKMTGEPYLKLYEIFDKMYGFKI